MISLFNKKGPADFVFRKGYSSQGSYLFSDGTFGFIGDPDFDASEFIDDPDYDILEFDDREEYEAYLRKEFGGKLPIGNMYIDRWTPEGKFIQGDCFLYYEGETIRDWCDRNGYPYPERGF